MCHDKTFIINVNLGVDILIFSYLYVHINIQSTTELYKILNHNGSIAKKMSRTEIITPSFYLFEINYLLSY